MDDLIKKLAENAAHQMMGTTGSAFEKCEGAIEVFLHNLAMANLKIAPTNDWPPIESAPRDGKPFVAVNVKHGIARVVRCGEFLTPSNWGERGWFGFNWEDGDTDDEFYTRFTHWMPFLPHPQRPAHD
jgi:hypothetical protein